MAKRKKSTGRAAKRPSGRAKLSSGAVRDLDLLRGKARSARGGALSPTSLMGRMQPGMGRIRPSSPRKRL